MSYISERLRGLVSERAQDRCEYCLLHNEDAYPSHEVEHIFPEKHGGATEEDNLCLSCFDCNRHKGSDISSIDLETKQLTSFFNPRREVWSEHFRLEGAVIQPLTAIGRVTVRLLQMNSEDRLAERALLIQANRYPR